jgi:hypothetical protein
MIRHQDDPLFRESLRQRSSNATYAAAQRASEEFTLRRRLFCASCAPENRQRIRGGKGHRGSTMTQEKDDDVRKAFRALHDPARPVFHMGHARRGNTAEDYKSGSILETSARLLKHSIKAAHGVLENFAKHARRPS